MKNTIFPMIPAVLFGPPLGVLTGTALCFLFTFILNGLKPSIYPDELLFVFLGGSIIAYVITVIIGIPVALIYEQIICSKFQSKPVWPLSAIFGFFAILISVIAILDTDIDKELLMGKIELSFFIVVCSACCAYTTARIYSQLKYRKP